MEEGMEENSSLDIEDEDMSDDDLLKISQKRKSSDSMQSRAKTVRSSKKEENSPQSQTMICHKNTTSCIHRLK